MQKPAMTGVSLALVDGTGDFLRLL